MRLLLIALLFTSFNSFVIAQMTVTGTVEGYIYPKRATDQKVLETWNFGDLLINNELAQTNQLGVYTIVVEDGLASASAGPLKARHLVVKDFSGPEISFDSTPTEATTIDWVWNDTTSVIGDDTEVNVWYHITEMYNFVKDENGPFRWDIVDSLGNDTTQVSVRENFPNLFNCGAGNFGGIIKFGQARPDTCLNNALDSDVIYHEYGHRIFRAFYKGNLSGQVELLSMNEAFSDYWAAIINEDSKINEGGC